MLDWQLYGPNPWGHHLTSVLIHAANAVLVFLVLRALTGAWGRSLFAALLFALHPLRVESVAWIAERKDVLGALFWLLALWSYAVYVKTKTSRPGRAAVHYGLVLLWFALGLMSKPMLVTLPCTLLLLDYWPLHRLMGTRAAGASGVGKDAVFFMAAAGSADRVSGAKKAIGASHCPLSRSPIALENAAPSLRPLPRQIFLPHWPGHSLSASEELGGAARPGRARAAAGRFGGRVSGPARTALWRDGLVVVFGHTGAGHWPGANRVTIHGRPLHLCSGPGLDFHIDVGSVRPGHTCPFAASFSAGAGTAVLVLACGALTRQQIGFWKDSGTVFAHAIDVTENSFLARKALADFYCAQGRLAEAEPLYRQALEMYPAYEGAHLNLAIVLNQTGRDSEAIAEFKTALQLQPDDASAYNDLGAVLGEGHLDESIALFQKAIEVNPNYYPTPIKISGRAMESEGHLPEAVAQYQAALRLRPDPDAWGLLGQDLEKLGRNQEAIAAFNEALKYQPNKIPAARQAMEQLKKRNGN